MSDKDTIYRQSAIDAVSRGCLEFRGIFAECEKNLNELPPVQSDNGYSDGFTDGYKRGLTDAQPDNQINLCDSCDYSYPDCPSKDDDVIFGNGIGNDNICACNKYKPSVQPEREKGEWNRYYRTHSRDTFVCNKCGSCFVVLQGEDKMDFCPHCGSDMRGKQDDESRSNSNAQTDTRARGMGATDKSNGI